MADDLLTLPEIKHLFLEPGIIAISGGGGKTSLLHALLRSLKAKEVVAVGAVTTKTRLWDEHDKQLIFVNSAVHCREAALQAAGCERPAVLCRMLDPDNPNKVLGIPPEWLDEAARAIQEGVFVVECDGSAGKPLKGHLPYEPVVPRTSRLVVPVVGLEAVGAALDDLQVHRVQRLAELIGITPREVLTPRVIARLLIHPEGYRYNLPPGAQFLPLLNKADTCGRLKAGLAVCRELAKLDLEEPEPVMAVIASIHNRFYAVRKLKH